MKKHNTSKQILCIVLLVAVSLCLCIALYTATSLRRQLDDTLSRATEAESLVVARERDLSNVREKLKVLESDNAALQSTNDKLHVALSAYDYDFSIEAPTPPYYLDVPVDKELQSFIWSMCCDYDIEEHYVLVYAIMRQESNFRSDVVSSTDDYGLMQINISNHNNLSKRLGITDFLDPYQNVQAGIYMLANALHKYGGVSEALMAYNMGGGGASKLWSQGIYSTSYSRSVLAYYNQFMENI